ncbi:NYN domain-containing protein [Eubacteriales bacterium OttesenSCG-928-N13]|nr:NYN domain-containing protein [Eubacteriales bacterium OttesenSCG-928-N13]
MAAHMRKRLLIVDGYNVLNQGVAYLSGKPLDDARDRLIRELHDYAAYSDQQLTLVFDAWQSDRKQRTIERTGHITVVFTKRGETADQYIERLCDEHARDVDLGRLEIRVATSDGVEQTIVFGRGATRIPARELLIEMDQMRSTGVHAGKDKTPKKSTVMDGLPPHVREQLERMRRGQM